MANNNNGKGNWNPSGVYSAYGDDYYEEGNKYGKGQDIQGSGAAPNKPKKLAGMDPSDMNNKQQNTWNAYQKEQNKYEKTDNYYANANPENYFSSVMSKAGYTPGGSTPFEKWLSTEFGQINAGYQNASQQNNQLNFSDYLKTFGNEQQFGQFLLNRYQSRTPDEQGLGTAPGTGSARWSVF